MNAAPPTRQHLAKLLRFARANGIPLTPIPAMNSADFKTTSAPHPDGFGGARDASILKSYDREGDFVMVQAVARTKDLLKRAGVARIKTHAFYKVPVVATLAGLQLNGTAVAG